MKQIPNNITLQAPFMGHINIKKLHIQLKKLDAVESSALLYLHTR